MWNTSCNGRSLKKIESADSEGNREVKKCKRVKSKIQNRMPTYVTSQVPAVPQKGWDQLIVTQYIHYLSIPLYTISLSEPFLRFRDWNREGEKCKRVKIENTK